MRLFYSITCFVLVTNLLSASGITIHKKDAEVWSVNQTINGSVEGEFNSNGILYINEEEIPFTITENEFSVDVVLKEGENILLAEIDSSGTSVLSDTLKLTLAYELLPEAYVYAEAAGRSVSLKADILDNPKNVELNFNWYADEDNPAELTVTGTDSTASATIPEGFPLGEYYFRLLITTSENDSVKVGTYVTVDSTGITPFDIKNDYASWIDSAVVYEVTPYIFVNRGEYDNITKKIPELAEFGINTLWLQPCFGTEGGGQGYDITNYFKIRTDLGPVEDLEELIRTAKAHGMRVLFDFVANHSSSAHRYARDAIRHGEDSHYYYFYQREDDNAPYSQHYNFTSHGFMYYFWTDLWLYNFEHPEVHKWLTEAATYWVKKYDIDGYRFDAIWGPNARDPQFTKDLRLALKRIKPELFLLAEDKATWDSVFDERFDAAYDWAPSENWVSEWVWANDYSENSNPTIFNSGNQNSRALRLLNSLTNYGNGYASDAKIFRFMENNDTFHFITHHSLAQTKMVAALLFSLNGIPMIYNGQEIGAEGHPYSTEFLFFNGFSIESRDGVGLYPYYKRLIEIRTSTPALYSDNFEEINIEPDDYTYAYRRWEEDQNIIGLINMGNQNQSVDLSLEVEKLNLDSSETYYLTDMINGEVFETSYTGLANITLPVESYTTRIFQLADTVLTVVGIEDDLAAADLPKEFNVSQNYPNPFNPATIISYSLPSAGKVTVKVFDAIGREVKELVNGFEEAGVHELRFNAGSLASGVYFYRVQFENNITTKKMILIK